MWFSDAVFYQIYPLGLCGAPAENDGVQTSRLATLHSWVPHLSRLGVSVVYLCPVFESDRHGYDTRDYRTVDCRLGSNTDLAQLCDLLHSQGIRVVLDGVFNHVGRGFWAFRDVQQNRERSPYCDWFKLNFGGNSNYNDGFWYEGWEGHYELVKLNLKNPAVVQYIYETVAGWVQEFGIDGLRLDVAYSLDLDFLAGLRSFCDSRWPDFLLLGELLHGDYNRWVDDSMLHSCTNYECYKGLYSSFNDLNLFEIAHSLQRQFGTEQWCLYRGKQLLSFADNHDVTRIATQLRDSRQLRPLYGLLFAMPGVPSIYYGSEWGIAGDKKQGDNTLRPALAAPEWNDLTDWLQQLVALRRQCPALCHGSYRNVVTQNRHMVLERAWQGVRVLATVNAGDSDCRIGGLQGRGRSLLTGAELELAELSLPPFGFDCFEMLE